MKGYSSGSLVSGLGLQTQGWGHEKHWLCHKTVTPTTPRLQQNLVMCCIVVKGLSSAMISSLRNSVHPPKMEINALKMAWGCPCGVLIWVPSPHPTPPKNSHKYNLLAESVEHLFVNIYIYGYSCFNYHNRCTSSDTQVHIDSHNLFTGCLLRLFLPQFLSSINFMDYVLKEWYVCGATVSQNGFVSSFKLYDQNSTFHAGCLIYSLIHAL